MITCSRFIPKWAPLLVLFAYGLQGCDLAGREKEKINHYQLSKPEKFLMPESLLEVSGIAFYKGKSDTVYAIQDEQGRLFRLAWGVKKQVNSKFGKRGDYEDLAIVNDRFFVLKSNGTIFSFPVSDAIYQEIDDAKEWKGLLPQGEYEGIYGDDKSGNLYVICKNCSEDNAKNEVTGYILHGNDSLQQSGIFHIDVNAIKSFTGKVKRGFRPSALAQNPVTLEWFIISSVNKLLVVTDKDFKIKEACLLNGNVFNQPEGIAFDSAGNLYISNEGDDFSQGNILKFTRMKN